MATVGPPGLTFTDAAEGRTSERMAVAVLKGDLAAARQLADLLCEGLQGGAVELPPVRRLSVDAGRVRIAAFISPEVAILSREDALAIRHNLRNWLTGTADEIIILHGISRVELYELPEAPP